MPKWNRNYELARNKHWKQKSEKVPLITANVLFTHRQRTVNMLTDNNPTFNVTRVGTIEADKEEAYEKYRRAAEFWWGEQEQQSLLEKSVLNGETYSCTVEKLMFNAEREYGLGEVETIIVDPYYFGFYPVRCEDIQKAEAVLYFRPMSVREARRRWPAKAKEIRADSDYLDQLGDARREVQGGRPSEPAGYFSTFAGIVRKFIDVVRGKSGKVDDELLIVEAWVKDYTMEPNPAYQESAEEPVQAEVSSLSDKNIIEGMPQSGTPEEGVQPPETVPSEAEKKAPSEPKFIPKYVGYIRCVTCCNGGEVVLDDRSNPSINPNLPLEQAINTYLYDKYPFSLTPSVTDNVIAWGVSDYEQLEGLQIEIDKTLSQFTLWKDKASRLKIINPQNSGVENSEITNYPTIIRPTNEMVAQGIRYMDPPVPPVDLQNSLTVYKDWFYLVSGAFELEQAQVPGREVIAYKAIAALLERATLMLKGKIRNYSKMIRERGRMYISLAQNWYTEERWISYDEDGESKSLSIRGEELIIHAKLTVVSGSTMPKSKVQEREEAIALAKDGKIDNEELLKKLDWPNWKEVVKRMQAGPLGAFIEKLAAIQVPQPILALFQQIAGMDDKKFAQGLKAGEIPDFTSLLTSLAGGGTAPSPAPSITEEAEAKLKEAETKKVEMETKLVEEQIMTEQVEQEVAMWGIHYDSEELKNRRAEVVAKIEQATGKEAGVPSGKKRGTRPFRERGMKSDNQKKKE
jgi:hypothetical protein